MAPFLPRGKDTSAPDPFIACSVGDPNGPRSHKCPFNIKAQQLHTTLMGEGKSLTEVNTQMRERQLINPRPTLRSSKILTDQTGKIRPGRPFILCNHN